MNIKIKSLILFLTIIICILMNLSAEEIGLKWEQIKADKIGFRNNAFIFYHDKSNKFYIFGGHKNDKWTKESKILDGLPYIMVDAETYEVEKYIPMENLPKNKKGRSYFPGSGGRIYVPEEDSLYCIEKSNVKSFLIYKYDISKKTLVLLNQKIPEVKYDGIVMGEYGDSVGFMSSVSFVYDSHNKEIVFIGGKTLNAPDGFVGHWAFDCVNKSWRKFNRKDEQLKSYRESNRSILKNLRMIEGKLSNHFFNAQLKKNNETNTSENLKDIITQLSKLLDDLEKYKGYHSDSVDFSKSKLKKAISNISTIQKSIETNSFKSVDLRLLYDVDCILDETADLFLDIPSERTNAGITYNKKNNKIILFGGDHGNYLLNDTWLYDCKTKLWKRIFPKSSPTARLSSGVLFNISGSDEALLLGGKNYIKKFIYFSRSFNALKDGWKFDFSKNIWIKIAGSKSMKSFSNPMSLNKKNELFGIATSGKYRKIKVSYWKAALDTSNEIKEEIKIGPDARSYLSVVKEYNPTWYIEDELPKKNTVEAWIKTIPNNVWIDVPKATRPCPTRDWGTSILDPDRDQFYHWTGGHMADPSDIVATYHIGTNKWSIPYIASYHGKGISYEGRPDCKNHTYLNYAYDTKSKKLILSATGGLFIFDPDTRQYEKPIASDHYQHAYYTKLKSTPYGVMGWVSNRKRLFALFNAEKRQWDPISLKKGSPFPRAAHGDEAAFEYDLKRDCMWFFTAKSYRKFDGGVYKYDFKNKRMEVIPAKNKDSIGSKTKNLRETAYLKNQDVILLNGFLNFNGKKHQMVFDPDKLSWALLPISIKSKAAKKDLGGVSVGFMYDPKRNLVWAMSVRQNMYVFKPEFKKEDLIYEVKAPEAKIKK